jgi:serine/threonine protein kinase/Tol biopolymer transport system component
MPLAENTRVGRYRIRSRIGAGGMGEVYLAQDTELKRFVALKILPDDFVKDKHKLHRFKQEAYAVSALNHPNILTIHEIGISGGCHFIATEFVEGESLRDRMIRTKMNIEEASDVAAQVALALAAAHQTRIVHRDIKPENIVLRPDGIVKVLDFGLAKLAPSIVDGSAPTEIWTRTDPGVVMGTVNYMSPEQARGLQVDGRSDIWSLGVVLYEMTTGQMPFAGPTASDIIAAILKTEPSLQDLYFGKVPGELIRIIKKTLQKKPDERYQLAKELALDLKNFTRDLEVSREVERSVPPSVRRSSSANSGLGPPYQSGQRTTQIITPQPTSGAEYLTGEFKQYLKIALAGFLSLVLLAGLAGLGLVLFWPRARAKPRSEPMRLARLTTSGSASRAAISPDGKYVVHISDAEGLQTLRVRQVNINSDVQIVAPSEAHYQELSFSPDGDFIYYVAAEKNSSVDSLYKMPVLGGTSRKIISDVGSGITFSPDGKDIAFIRDLVERGEQVLIVAPADGGNERTVATRKFPNFFSCVAWSPDGKSLACGAGTYVPTYNSYALLLPADGGTEKQLPAQTWLSIGNVAWTPDGKALIVEASQSGSGTFDGSQLWIVPIDQSEARPITHDLNDYSGVSVTADGSRLLTVQSGTFANIWLISAAGQNSPIQLTTGSAKNDGRTGIAWTPKEQIVFVSQNSGNDDIWVTNADGSDQRQLTSKAGINNNPTVSADGRFIVFTSTRTGAPHIWRMDNDGSNAKQLTSGSTEGFPEISPDGKWVVYTLFAGETTLWRVSIEGGAPEPVTSNAAAHSAISPDGKSIATMYWGTHAKSAPRLAVLSFAGGEPAPVFDVAAADWGNVHWTPDGRGIAYTLTRAGVSNIWIQPLAGGPAKQVTDFKSDKIFWFDWSRNNRIVCSRGAETSDVVLINNFR